MTTTDRVASRAEAAFDKTLAHLAEYLRIPAISCEVEHAADVRRLAEKVRDDLAALGMDDARLLELEGAHPCVAAQRLRVKGAPTLLVYGHLDLQPVVVENWKTPPHEPTRVGDRLYGRGAADDMGGWVSHLAAISAWLDEAGELPLNIKLIIEAEEEIGSPHLEAYMDAYPDAFAGDVMVLTDCENPHVDIPGLTISLRGLLEVTLTCESLASDVHSGLWGNMVPDPAIALMQLVSRLVDEDGRLAFGRVEVPDSFRDATRDVLPTETIRSDAGLVPGVEPLPLRDRPAAEWLWRQPAVTVLSTSLPQPGKEKNAVRAKASAVLSLRVAPGQTADELFAAIEGTLRERAPGGVKVTLEKRSTGDGGAWLYEPKGPVFPAADRAYEKAWGKPLTPIGVGGSIPFVAMFGRRFGDLPLILNGVMDPKTGAHGPNESLHLGVLRRAILANVYLYQELSEIAALRG